MSETLKSKLVKLEQKVKLEKVEEQKHQEDQNIILEMLEYANKERQMTMTPEEIIQSNKAINAEILVWYSRWQKMSEEERKLDDAEREKNSVVEKERFRAWRNSKEGKKFDEEYARRFSSKDDVLQ